MVAIRSIALIVRFLLELALLAGAAVIAFALLPAPWDWIGAIAAVIGIATVWGLLLSPRAPIRMREVAKLVLETVLFVAVAAGLWAVGLPVPALVGLAVWLVHRIVLGVVQVRTPFE